MNSNLSRAFAFVHAVFPRGRRIEVYFKTFTPSNTGLTKSSVYPEMGSGFKAAAMKAFLWFFAWKSVQLVEKHPAAP